MSYKKDVLKGISWTGGLSLLTKTIGFLETIILARILVPYQFGAYAVALLSLGLLEVFTETGINTILIQEVEIDEWISSAWVVSIVRGLVIMVVLFFSTPYVASFFHSAASLNLLYLLSLVPLLRGFINPSVVKFQKELMFGKDFFYRFFILLVDTTISITVTYLLRNPIGIALGLLAGVIVELVLSFLIVVPRPNLNFKIAYIKIIFHRGKWITGTSIFDYLFCNVDNIVVGRLLGPSALGIYQLAYALAVIPLGEIGGVFSHVLTPIMVRIANDLPRLRKVFAQAVLSVFLLALPAVCIFVFAPNIFVWILGQKWLAVVTILPILAMLGLTRSFLQLASALFLSLRKQNLITLITLISIISLFILIVPLIKNYGLTGAGIAALISSLVVLPLTIYFIIKICKQPKITT